MKFVEFKKIPRLSRDVIITEKIDGSNGQICIFSLETLKKEFDTLEQMSDWIEQYCLYVHPDNPHVEEKDKLYIFAASRNRWLNVGKQNDNHAFAYWVKENAPSLVMLGEGRHFGEWYGKGIQRGYGLEEKRWALFNVSKWQNKDLPLVDEKQKYPPSCCEVVPILYEGMFDTNVINVALEDLRVNGSKAVPGYLDAEGVCIFHTASGHYYKKTLQNDEKHKGEK
jgi:hypothetical protein